MRSNFLKLNDDKIELLIISSKQMQSKVRFPGLKIGDCTVEQNSCARNLGVIIDSTLSLDNHVSTAAWIDYSVCKTYTAARLITRKSMREHITPVLKELHWLPVRLRIVFKLIMFVYKSIHGLSPVYLQELTALYQPGRTLRSANKLQLAVPPTSRTTYGDRTFRKAGATLWNALPIDVRGSEDVNTFRSKLKTILFKRAYD
ncbi:uncharacterized protein LOC125373275 [Haliotis rufescens]|uniref:uncharacterized protein LOC125373275 n=1 Tax=Haliotis rufescens TaxID=6454 RepID=UPI00201F229A|nr:uncharacterized protein LOC125373275 [Haliotis rufescens]